MVDEFCLTACLFVPQLSETQRQFATTIRLASANTSTSTSTREEPSREPRSNNTCWRSRESVGRYDSLQPDLRSIRHRHGSHDTVNQSVDVCRLRMKGTTTSSTACWRAWRRTRRRSWASARPRTTPTSPLSVNTLVQSVQSTSQHELDIKNQRSCCCLPLHWSLRLCAGKVHCMWRPWRLEGILQHTVGNEGTTWAHLTSAINFDFLYVNRFPIFDQTSFMTPDFLCYTTFAVFHQTCKTTDLLDNIWLPMLHLTYWMNPDFVYDTRFPVFHLASRVCYQFS